MKKKRVNNKKLLFSIKVHTILELILINYKKT